MRHVFLTGPPFKHSNTASLSWCQQRVPLAAARGMRLPVHASKNGGGSPSSSSAKAQALSADALNAYKASEAFDGSEALNANRASEAFNDLEAFKAATCSKSIEGIEAPKAPTASKTSKGFGAIPSDVPLPAPREGGPRAAHRSPDAYYLSLLSELFSRKGLTRRATAYQSYGEELPGMARESRRLRRLSRKGSSGSSSSSNSSEKDSSGSSSSSHSSSRSKKGSRGSSSNSTSPSETLSDGICVGEGTSTSTSTSNADTDISHSSSSSSNIDDSSSSSSSSSGSGNDSVLDQMLRQHKQGVYSEGKGKQVGRVFVAKSTSTAPREGMRQWQAVCVKPCGPGCMAHGEGTMHQGWCGFEVKLPAGGTAALLQMEVYDLQKHHRGAGEETVGGKRFDLPGHFEALLVEDVADLPKAVEWLRSSINPPNGDGLLSIDLEWRPEHVKNERNRLALVQLATGSRCLLVHLARMGPDLSAGDLTPLSQLLIDPAVSGVVTAGWSAMEQSKVEESLGITKDDIPSLLDLQTLAAAAGAARVGLQSLVQGLLGLPKWRKSKTVTRSNWESPLSLQMMKYAILDGFLPGILLRQLRFLHSVPFRCDWCMGQMYGSLAPSVRESASAMADHLNEDTSRKTRELLPANEVIKEVCEHCGRGLPPSHNKSAGKVELHAGERKGS